MQSITIQIKNIGTVFLEKSRRARHLSISVSAGGRVRVAIPWRQSFQDAQKFALLKRHWIEKQLKKLNNIQQKNKVMLASMRRLDKTEAKIMLVNRLNLLAEEYGFHYNTVSIRNQKTRWGSCSTRNNINLNIKLAVLPDKLIDYVILHELMHTRIKNHSKAFWQTLDVLVGNAKILAKELRDYGMALD
jgi:predicted metal-dependent hydrolase